MCFLAGLLPVLAAFWIGDITLGQRLLLTAIYLAILAVAQWWPWAYFGVFLYLLGTYFLFFGSQSNRRWRP